MYLALKTIYKNNMERKTNLSQPNHLTLPFVKTSEELLMKRSQLYCANYLYFLLNFQGEAMEVI